jgi:nitrile hydratase
VNGIHDLGGMDGLGPVVVEANEPVFHAPWERRVFGMAAAMSAAALRNLHEFRHAIERMDPAHYLHSSYYEHWLTGLATLLVEKGLITRRALDERAGGRVPLSRPVLGGVPAAPADAPRAAPRFAVGDVVRVRNLHPTGHTRCPRYVRGRRGVVIRVDPRFVVPDLAAHGVRSAAETTYGVRFAARELWGEHGGERDAVHVDLWESYLEAP